MWLCGRDGRLGCVAEVGVSSCGRVGRVGCVAEVGAWIVWLKWECDRVGELGAWLYCCKASNGSEKAVEDSPLKLNTQ